MSDDRFSLQAGIPLGADWPAQVQSATENLRQGDLVADPPFVYAADAETPIHATTRAWAQAPTAASGVVHVTNPEKRSPFGIIATQTCDLVEEGEPKRPWVHLCPVYPLDASRGDTKLIVAGRFNYFTEVTGLEPNEGLVWVADLRLLTPIEKGWLVGRTTRPGFTTQAGYDRFAEKLGNLFARTAYATSVGEHVLRPLSKLLRAVAKDFNGDDAIAEVGLAQGRDRLNPVNVEVVFMLDRDLDPELRARIMDWWSPVCEAARLADLELLPPRFVLMTELSAAEYVTLDPVGADDFSPEA